MVHISLIITILIGIQRSLKGRCESKIGIVVTVITSMVRVTIVFVRIRKLPFFVTIATLMIPHKLIPNNCSLPGDRYLNLGSKSDHALA